MSIVAVIKNDWQNFFFLFFCLFSKTDFILPFFSVECWMLNNFGWGNRVRHVLEKGNGSWKNRIFKYSMRTRDVICKVRAFERFSPPEINLAKSTFFSSSSLPPPSLPHASGVSVVLDVTFNENPSRGTKYCRYTRDGPGMAGNTLVSVLAPPSATVVYRSTWLLAHWESRGLDMGETLEENNAHQVASPFFMDQMQETKHIRDDLIKSL